MAAMTTDGTGNIVIKSIGNAIGKDTRTLFTDDNLKQKWKQNKEVPNIHILSYYGDITGPHELKLRNKCKKIITEYSKNLDKSSPASNIIDMCHDMFKESNIEIVYISHYAFEFVVNVTNTMFIENYKLNHKNDNINSDKKVNTYLVGAYQKLKYHDIVDEFITIGLTENISYLNNPLLYKFYIDDFIQDLFKILSYTSWYDDTCKLWDNMYYIIAGYTVDCILPVKYKRGAGDEILLNDGALHLMLSGDLEAFQPNNDNSTLKIITQLMTNLGRLINEEHMKTKYLRSEYNKWKKQSFKKRVNLRPSNMNQLNQILTKHINERNQSKQKINSIRNLNYLYYNNHFNFKLSFKHKKNKNKYAMRSFRKLFGKLGSSKNKNKNKKQKQKHNKTQTYHIINDLIDINNINDLDNPEMLSRSRTAPSPDRRPGKYKENKSKIKYKRNKNKNYNNNAPNMKITKSTPAPSLLVSQSNAITTQNNNLSALTISASITKEISNIGANIKDTTSLPAFGNNTSAVSSASATSISKSHSNPRNKNQKNNYLNNGVTRNDTAISTDPLDGGLSNSKLSDTHSDEYDIMKRKLQITQQKSQNKLNKHQSTFAQSMNVGGLVYIDYDEPTDLNTINEDNNNNNQNSPTTSPPTKKIVYRHKRTQSAAEMRLYEKVRNAYDDYLKKKNKVPAQVDYFITFCRKRKIKGVNWTVCEAIMKEMSKKT